MTPLPNRFLKNIRPPLRNWPNEAVIPFKVLRLHTMLINETGGSDDLRDEGLLDSALHG